MWGGVGGLLVFISFPEKLSSSGLLPAYYSTSVVVVVVCDVCSLATASSLATRLRHSLRRRLRLLATLTMFLLLAFRAC